MVGRKVVMVSLITNCYTIKELFTQHFLKAWRLDQPAGQVDRPATKTEESPSMTGTRRGSRRTEANQSGHRLNPRQRLPQFYLIL